MSQRKGRLLQVDGLTVEYGRRNSRPIRALDQLSFTLRSGECLGVFGESGSGKSSLATSLLRLLPAGGRQEGKIRFGERRLDQLSAALMTSIRGSELALIYQDPSASLHPMRRVGSQILDVLQTHRKIPRPQARRDMLDRLHDLGLEEPDRIARSYPHQLSDGQRQRVAIARALACDPLLVIADEPTTALDPALRDQVLHLFERLAQERSSSWIFISHEPQVLKRMADRVLVLYAGRLVEEGPTDQVLERPRHPYTKGLLASLPPWPPPAVPARERPPLQTLSGEPIIVHQPASDCRFAPRCPRCIERCTKELPIEFEVMPGQKVWCWSPGEPYD